MKIIRVIETSAPLDRVHAYLSDFTTTNEWDPGTVETVRVSGDGGVGTRYRNTSRFLGRETRLTYVVREVVPDSRLVLQGDNRTVRAVDTMTFESVGGRTRVTYDADFTFKGVTKYAAVLLSPVLALAFKKLGDEAEQGMQDALDRLAA
jgi:uncharacterized protein YndB with AHSA1/START domain